MQWSDTQDEGGLFRASTRDICAELQSESLPLLVPAPNANLGVEGRDRWIPNPSVDDGDDSPRSAYGTMYFTPVFTPNARACLVVTQSSQVPS